MNTTIEQRDHMPHQVATELLTTPKTRLTNRMRKTCLDARAKYYPSTSPLRRVKDEYEQTNIIKKSVEEKMRNRMKAATSPQLEKWLKRCAARRRNVQERYLKTQNETGPKWDYIRQVLEATAQRVDLMRDIIEEVLQERQDTYKDSVFRHLNLHLRHSRVNE